MSMIDFIPTNIDGAIVLNLQNGCKQKSHPCDNCCQALSNIHNWIKYSGLSYVIVDLLDEKEICGTFLEEIFILRKRLKIPFVFVGASIPQQAVMQDYLYFGGYPMFLTPEDAIRALRMKYPGMTEHELDFTITFGLPIQPAWKRIQAQDSALMP